MTALALSTAPLVAKSATDAGVLERPSAKVVTDRPGALYSVGETAVFTISVKSQDELANQGIATVKLSLDGGRVIAENIYDLAEANPFEISASLDEPGFIRCDFMGVSNYPHSLRARAAAGFDVEKIVQGHPEPDDFDSYWLQLLTRQKAIENAVRFDPLPDDVGKSGYHYFKVTAKTIDQGRVYGFLGVPAGKPGPLPAMVIVAAAGSGYTIPEPKFIRPDMITLTMNVHPIDTGLPAGQYKRRFAELTADSPYWKIGGVDRDRHYFRNAILGIYSAAEALAEHPQFDGEELLYLGVSQGGGFGLILGGLIPRFSAIAVGAPALCDHGGFLAGRSAGWPKLVDALSKEDEALRQKALDMSGYYDAVNFAKRIKGPVMFTVGFNDATCPPSSVYAAFNAVSAPKYINNSPQATHAVPWEQLNGLWQWVQHRLDNEHRFYIDYFSY